ncbi:MAG: M15 family metallopeptidase [Pseudomonadota bacterium]
MQHMSPLSLDITRSALREWGLSPTLIEERGLPLFPEAKRLAVAEVDASGREYLLVPPAVQAWRAMKVAAESAGIAVHIFSAYRSIDYQRRLISRRIADGQAPASVLSLLAPPGCSEHHTGRAIDVGTPGCAPVNEAFEATGAFEWLMGHAADFGFSLSYPRNNRWGYVYEPWHWCWHAAAGPERAG